jgi:hypothetical protein
MKLAAQVNKVQKEPSWREEGARDLLSFLYYTHHNFARPSLIGTARRGEDEEGENNKSTLSDPPLLLWA